MSGIKRVLVALAFAACCAAGPVLADDFEIFPVGSSGSVTPQTLFVLDHTPFIYVKLPSAGPHVARAFWQSPTGNHFFTSTPPFATGNEHWFSLDDPGAINESGDPTSWDSAKHLGHWNVGADAFYADRTFAGGQTAFDVITPEPASIVLFGGGLLLAAGLRRRRKRTTI
jgi:hypothetical protein